MSNIFFQKITLEKFKNKTPMKVAISSIMQLMKP